MTEQPATHHVRNLTIIAVGIIFLVVAWNAFGAYQCSARDGEITRNGVSLGCKLDYSNR